MQISSEIRILQDIRYMLDNLKSSSQTWEKDELIDGIEALVPSMTTLSVLAAYNKNTNKIEQMTIHKHIGTKTMPESIFYDGTNVTEVFLALCRHNTLELQITFYPSLRRFNIDFRHPEIDMAIIHPQSLIIFDADGSISVRTGE